jgi:transcriptional regulator with XRE-family HTH domain
MRQLSSMVGISNPYLSQIEHGLRRPSEAVLEALARSLQVSVDTLYEQAGRANEDEDPPVVAAIREDERLTARQRSALLEIYDAFRAENDARRAARTRRT